MTIHAKRIIFPEPNRAELADFEVPEPVADELLLRTEHSAISAGTEGANFSGLELEHPGRQAGYAYPRLQTGYASVARVVRVGPEQVRFKPGDRVLTFSPHASYWIWKPERLTLPLPEDLPGERGVFVRMGGVSATALRVSSVRAGDTVAVIGLGVVGNLAAQLFQLSGAEVLGLDVEDRRLEQARACGIRNVASARDGDLAQLVLEWTGGRGAQIVVEAIGSPDLIERGAHSVRRNGELVLLGSPRKRMTMDVTPLLSRVHLYGIRLLGALEWNFPMEDRDHHRVSLEANYRQVARWIQDERLKVDPLRTHVLSPAQCQDAYHGLVYEKQQYTAVVFDWSRV